MEPRAKSLKPKRNLMRTFNKIFSLLLTIILSFSLVTVLVFVILNKASGGEPEIMGYQLKTVLSGSMEPAIQTGSIILIKKTTSNASFKKNDIVTFIDKEERLITHRIIDVNKTDKSIIYQTKGDHNDAPDLEPVLSENIVGSYSGITIPYVGYVVQFTQSKLGSALLFILPGILLLGYSIVIMRKTFKELDRITTTAKAD